MKLDILTDALSRLDVSMIYGVVRDAGLGGSSRGGAADVGRTKMKVLTRASRSAAARNIIYASVVLPLPPRNLCRASGLIT